MAALTAGRVPPEMKLIDRMTMPLKDTTAVFKGGIAAIDTSVGKVTKGAVSATLINIGFFAEDKASGTNQTVEVQFGREVKAYWLDNTDTGHTAAATDLGKVCYLLDDHTITMNSTGASKAGRIWGVATVNGVASALVELFAPANGDS